MIYSCCCTLVFCMLSAAAQRYAVIDTKYILDKLPEYKDAQKKLDQFSEQWQKEIDAKQASWIRCTGILKLNRYAE